MRLLFDCLASRNSDGYIHYYEVIKLASKAGIGFKELNKVKNPGENTPITSQRFSQIVTKQLVYKGPSGRNKFALSVDDISKIQNFWLSPDIVRVSPNQTMVMKRRYKSRQSVSVPVYYRLYSIKESYEKFKTLHSNFKCSRATFYKYKPKNVKKSKKKQDCCPICKESKIHIPRLQSLHHSKLNQADRDALAAYEFHYDTWTRRAKDYQTDLMRLSDSQALITIDFKANISLGKGPEEDSHVFFNAPQRTIFGAAVYFRKSTVTYKVMFTVVSPILNHDSLSVKKMLSMITNHGVFNHFNTQELIFWMDNAPSHFRNFENLATLATLGSKQNRKVKVNFFGEYHGKSECDRHFGLISRIYKEKTSYIGSADVNTTESFLNLYSSAIRSYGGCVIPTVGACYDELNQESSEKLNVVAMKFSIPEVDEFLNQTVKEQEAASIIVPYQRQKLEVQSSAQNKFALNMFYSFGFQYKNGLVSKITAKLNKKSKEKQYQCKLTEEIVDDYTVKIGTKTAARPKYSILTRLNNRSAFHNMR